MIKIRNIDAHRALHLSVAIHRRAGQQAHFFEGAVMLVAEQIVRIHIVRNVQVGPAVVCEVSPHRLHPEKMTGIIDSGLF